MERSDLDKLSDALTYRKRPDLAELIRQCKTSVESSGRFGSRWCSVLSTFQIRFPLPLQNRFESLTQEDRNVLYEAVLLIYPEEDNSPEITEIRYLPDFDAPATNVLEVANLDKVTWKYIVEQLSKCNLKILSKDFDGAVTNSRTLIESVCLHILESIDNLAIEYDGNLPRLFKKVAVKLKMSPGEYEDDNLRQILSGVVSIINGVSSLRNKYSDAHGAGPRSGTYRIDERHAVLTVNLAKTISEYLFLSFEKHQQVKS